MKKNSFYCAAAFNALKEGDFQKAMSLYVKLRKDMNTSAFDYNINLCMRYLGCENLNIKADTEINSAVNGEFDVPKNNIKLNNKICLIRIIGNDLPNLHSSSQSLDNLEFVVKNEPEYESVDKFFLINRIVSGVRREKIKKILKSYNKKYFEEVFDPNVFVSIPFFDGDLPKDSYWQNKKLSEWEKLCWEASRRKLKNAYLMNNNGARNYALKYGIKNKYEWVLPWDGNCFLSRPQYEEIIRKIKTIDSHIDYLIVPMERCVENKLTLTEESATNAEEEPQIAFRSNCKHHFASERVYGNQPKVELLKRLSVPGPWDEWKQEYPWKKIVVQPISSNKPLWEKVSSVFRLASGNVDAALSSKKRSNVRAESISNYIDHVYDYCMKTLNNSSKVDYLYYRASKEKNVFENANKLKIGEVFDNVYLVSLKNDVEKRLKVACQLKSLGIEFEYFEAINGYEGEALNFYDKYKKRPVGELQYYEKYCDYEKQRGMKLIESPGAVGYIYTYLKILNDAKLKNYNRILIVEDDVLFCEDFLVRAKNFMANIDSDWKIINFGASQYCWKDIDIEVACKNRFYLPRLHHTKGSFAIAFDKSVIDEVISNQKSFEAPFDNLPLGVLYEKYLGKCFVAFPYLVMPDVSKSTIRGERLQHDHANRVKWWVGDYKYPDKKINVGLVITSSYNIKYITRVKDSRRCPLNISYFYIDSNGLSPLHSLSSLSKDYSADLSSNVYSKCNLSIDLFYEVPKSVALTEEMVIDHVEQDLLNKSAITYALKTINKKKYEPVKGRVSVILPTYKRPLSLLTAAESVLSQSYEDIELIIIDDNGVGSEHCRETQKIVDKCKTTYPEKNIIYHQHKVNANGAAARNTGILLSTGEFISFLDDDDVYLPSRITDSFEVIKNTNQDIGGVYCGFLGWNSSEVDKTRFKAGDLTREILTLDYKKHYLHTNTATYKRDAIFYINGFDKSYKRHQDLEFNLRFFCDFKIGIVEKCLVELAPQKSLVDNKVYGVDMFRLKSKFLEDYKYIIEEFDRDTKKEIYSIHWREVARYTKDKSLLRKEIQSIIDNGPLQIELLTRD